MKSTLLGMFAIAALFGVEKVCAASVDGNNTAVVIQKEAKAASTGWQLLCVPVDPFNIGAGAGTITLAEVFPPSIYANGSQVIVGTEGDVTATIADNVWKYGAGSGEAAGGYELVRGTTVLFKAGDASSSQDVVFCGQLNGTVTPAEGGAGSIDSVGNDTNAACSLADIFKGTGALGTANSQVFHIAAAGQSSYTVYRKRGDTWYRYFAGARPEAVELEDISLAPGEAVYFYRAAE